MALTFAIFFIVVGIALGIIAIFAQLFLTLVAGTENTVLGSATQDSAFVFGIFLLALGVGVLLHQVFGERQTVLLNGIQFASTLGIAVAILFLWREFTTPPSLETAEVQVACGTRAVTEAMIGVEVPDAFQEHFLKRYLTLTHADVSLIRKPGDHTFDSLSSSFLITKPLQDRAIRFPTFLDREHTLRILHVRPVTNQVEVDEGDLSPGPVGHVAGRGIQEILSIVIVPRPSRSGTVISLAPPSLRLEAVINLESAAAVCAETQQ